MIETKVKAASAAAGVTGALVTLAMYLLNAVPAIASMDEGAKGALLVLVTAVVSYAATLGAGYLAKHTPRADVETRRTS